MFAKNKVFIREPRLPTIDELDKQKMGTQITMTGQSERLKNVWIRAAIKYVDIVSFTSISMIIKLSTVLNS